VSGGRQAPLCALGDVAAVLESLPALRREARRSRDMTVRQAADALGVSQGFSAWPSVANGT
jgi:hypothetical protein